MSPNTLRFDEHWPVVIRANPFGTRRHTAPSRIILEAMLIVRLEFGGVVSVHDEDGELLWRSGGLAALHSTPPDRTVVAGLRGALSQLAVDSGKSSSECVLIVPHNAQGDGVAQMCPLLDSEQVRCIGVIGSLRASMINPEDARPVLLQRGMFLGLADSAGSFEALTGLEEVFGTLYADVRARARSELSKDLVRINLSPEQVVGAALTTLVEPSGEMVLVPPGRGGGSVALPKTLFDYPLERLSHSLRVACEPAAGSGFVLGDDTLAKLLRFGDDPSSQWAECDVLDGVMLNRVIAGFVKKARSDLPLPFCVDGSLALAPSASSTSAPEKDTAVPRRRSVLVTALAVGLCGASTWAAVATAIAISQWRELNGLRNDIAMVTEQLPVADDEVEHQANPGTSTEHSATSFGGPAGVGEPEPVVAEEDRPRPVPLPEHLESRTTSAGYEMVFVASGAETGFWIGRYEVSNTEYKAFLEARNRAFGGQGASSLPVDGLTADEALEFCKWASEADPAIDYRLPTVDEWRLACLAGGAGPLGAGVNRSAVAASSNFVLAAVPSRNTVANEWGLHGFNGNVAEWVSLNKSGEYGLAGGSYRQDVRECGCDSVLALEQNATTRGGIRLIAVFVR